MQYKNSQLLLNKRPKGMPEDDCWKMNNEIITSLDDNEILIQVKYLSIDPYMRGRMNDGSSYAEPAKIGEPMTGETVGIVVETNSDSYAIGDKVLLIKVGKHLSKLKIMILLYIKYLKQRYHYLLI
jgi:hypothetical protein